MADVIDVTITDYSLDNSTITFEVTLTGIYSNTVSKTAEISVNGSNVGGTSLSFSGSGRYQETFEKTFNTLPASEGDDVQICVS